MEFTLVTLLFVLLIAWLAGFIANKLGFPAILGELAAGIIFGPALLGAIVLDPSLPLIGGQRLGFPESVPGLDVLAEVGVFLLLLYIGMEVDFRDLIKAGKAGLWAAAGGFLLPFSLGIGLAGMFDISLAGALFLGLAMGVTSVATKSRILVDLKLFGTRIANVLLAGALISDTAVLVIFALIAGLLGSEGFQVGMLVSVLLKTVLFFVLATVIGLKALPMLGDLLPRLGLKERTGNFTLVLLIGLIYAEMAHLLGLHAIIGAFMAGLFLRRGVLSGRLSHDISVLVRDLSVGFLAPIFFVTAGFHVSLSVIFEQALLVTLVLVLATAGKIIGTTVFYYMGRFNWREGLVVGCGMNGRGAVEIIIAEFALGLGLISVEIFSILVLMAFCTTLTVPIFLKWGTAWLRDRGELNRSDESRSGVVMIGATPLSRVLALEIQATGEQVVLIDSNRNRCEAATRDGLRVVPGNALSEEVLSIAGASEARALLAITPNAEVNTVAVQTARELYGIPFVGSVTPAPEDPTHEGHVPSPLLMQNVAHYEMWNNYLLRKEYERHSARIIERAALPDYINGLPNADQVIALGVVRQDRFLLPGDISELRDGDEIVYLRHALRTGEPQSRFSAALVNCPVIDCEPGITVAGLFRQTAVAMAPRLNTSSREIERRLLAREAESSTLIVPGLAIPHVEIEGENLFEILLARSQSGIPFHRGNGSESAARMIFILFSSRDQRNQHLRALSAIAQTAQNPTFETKWLEAASHEEIRQTVIKSKQAQ